MADQREVIASVQWTCPECKATGLLHLACVPDVLGVMGRCKALHRAASPKCEAFSGDYAQIDTPIDAEVNDPRERTVVAIDDPSAPMIVPAPRPIPRVALAAVVGALAAGGSAPRWNQRTPQDRSTNSNGALGPALLARAEAKRQRKAAKRRVAAPSTGGE